jgi:predicted small lipoprotein YifL
MKKTLSAAFVVAALTLTSACGGGGGGDRPSADDVAAQLKKSANGQITDKQADCAAKAIVDSDLSDEAVKAVAENDTDYKPSKADTEAQGDAATAIGKCITPRSRATPAPTASTLTTP